MTSQILAAIARHAAQQPEALALQESATALSYAELATEIARMQKRLMPEAASVIGLAVENSPAWAVIDLAAIAAGVPLVPLPGFFSAEQTIHAISNAGISRLISDQPIVMENLLETHGMAVSARQSYQLAGRWLTQFTLAESGERRLPPGTAKVTYTSGTTGQPKGVCLSLAAIEQVAQSLLQVTEAGIGDRHLSILPLSTLLENIAGLYVPLMAGARCTLLPSQRVGLTGATGLDPQRLLETIQHSQVTTLVLTPELLKALVMLAEAGHELPDSLRFVAVGGATVSHALLDRAAAVGLPVFEGYGLSECCSVVAVNSPKAHLSGSVGKPLPHVLLKFAEDGEILVSGSTMLGYTGAAKAENGNRFWPTGDTGYLDEAGYLYINGRKKNIFITSFGRNVSPEWVESQLAQSPLIAQAALFGEARPWNTAVIVPAAHAGKEEIDAVINTVNAGLPDYARVRRWVHADAPFSGKNQQLTANFRLRREAIWQAYANRINHLYEESADVCL